MGYKGLDNKDIQVDVKKESTKKQILEAYLPKDQKVAIDKEFKQLDKDLKREEAEVIKNTKGELADLQKSILAKNDLLKKYADLWSNNVTLESMNKKMLSVWEKYKDGDIASFLKKQGADVIFAAQIALNRAGYEVKVDGEFGPQTANALNEFNDRQNGANVFAKLATLLDSSWGAPRTATRQVERTVDSNGEELLMMKPDDLMNAGDKLFKDGNLQEASRYYNIAGYKEGLLNPANATDNKYYRHGIQSFLSAANSVMYQAKASFSNSTDYYKRGIVNEAKNILGQSENINRQVLTKMLLEANRDDLPGNIITEKVIDPVVAQDIENRYTNDLSGKMRAYITAYVNSYFGPIVSDDPTVYNTVEPTVAEPVTVKKTAEITTGFGSKSKEEKKVEKKTVKQPEVKEVKKEKVIIDGIDVTDMDAVQLAQKAFDLYRNWSKWTSEKMYTRVVALANTVDPVTQTVVANNLAFHSAQLISDGNYAEGYRYAKQSYEFWPVQIVQYDLSDRFAKEASTNQKISQDQKVELYHYAQNVAATDSIKNDYQQKINSLTKKEE